MARAIIVTVDDDPAVSQAITRDLRSRYGDRYRLARSTSGAEALGSLEEFARRDQPVALIVSDHRMPEMTGIELLGRSKAALTPALRWVSSTISAFELLSELTDTTNCISHLVEAVKSYSQMDRASLQRADIHDGIESTLVMLAPKLAGIEVERAFGSDRCHGEPRNAAVGDEPGRRCHRRRHHRQWPRNRPRRAVTGVRTVLHHEGCRQGHRAGARHLPSYRGRTPRRRDHLRLDP